jgi:hypothetical protein
LRTIHNVKLATASEQINHTLPLIPGVTDYEGKSENLNTVYNIHLLYSPAFISWYIKINTDPTTVYA